MNTLTVNHLDKRSTAYRILKDWLAAKVELDTIKMKEADMRSAALGVLMTCPEEEAVVESHLLTRKEINKTTTPYKALYTSALSRLTAKERWILLIEEDTSTKRSTYDRIKVKEVSGV